MCASTRHQQSAKRWDMMNLQQYLHEQEAYRNDGVTPTLDNGAYDLLRMEHNAMRQTGKSFYTRGTGKNTEVEAAISGGDANNTFRISAGYTHSTDILNVSGANQRGSLSIVWTSLIRPSFQYFVSSSYSFTRLARSVAPERSSPAANAPSVYDALATSITMAGAVPIRQPAHCIFCFFVGPLLQKQFPAQLAYPSYQPLKG